MVVAGTGRAVVPERRLDSVEDLAHLEGPFSCRCHLEELSSLGLEGFRLS